MCVCEEEGEDLYLKWVDLTGGQQSTLFLGPIKSNDTKIVQKWPSPDPSVTLREAVNQKVTHLEWWKGWCLMIFKKEQVMTKISLAVGRWYSVSLAFDRLVKGLHQQSCESLFYRLIFIFKVTSFILCGPKWWMLVKCCWRWFWLLIASHEIDLSGCRKKKQFFGVERSKCIQELRVLF